ncbi:MAG: hypothetical protein GIX03_01930 [Candidatus Eremiobacteraeota bacterium]|nr:hypothetical protein [Candidatus Eremiobacteraeota bacterium]
MEARADGSQVIPGGRNAILAAAFEPPAPLRDISDALAELARAVDQDLATPDHAPATERAYAHDWDDFSAFCGRHDLEALPAAPQTLALYLKTLETQRSRSPAGLSAGTIGLSLPTPAPGRDRQPPRERRPRDADGPSAGPKALAAL